MEQLLVLAAGNLGRVLASAADAAARASLVGSHVDAPQAGAVQAAGVVPVPLGLAIGILGGAVLLAILAFSRPVRYRIRHWYVAVNRWIDAV